MKYNHIVTGAVAVCALLASSPYALAADESFPSKPITLVVPFPAGGAADTLGRVVATKLSQVLAQPIVIENRGGASTMIGAGHVARAKPDGYTLLVTSGTTFTVNPAIRTNLPYDPIESFDPIGIVGRSKMVLLANSDVPVRNFGQFVDYVKASPGKYMYGSFGSGSTAHFAGETMLNATNLKMTHVPYNGSAPAMTNLMGGQIPFTVDTVGAALTQIKSGKIRPIALTSATRSPLLPEVPTMAESGYPDIKMDTWLMLAAPKGVDASVLKKLENALATTMADPETKAKLLGQGFEPAFSDSQTSTEVIKTELPVMRAVAERANIKAD